MLSNYEFNCPVCHKLAHPRIRFIGGEFQYECQYCKSIHLFSEAIFYNPNEHFSENSQKWNLGRYVGTYDVVYDCLYDASGNIQPQSDCAKKLIQAFKAKHDPYKRSYYYWNREKLTNNKPQGKIVHVAHALFPHFQDQIRACLRSMERCIYHPNRANNYNVLIIPESLGYMMAQPASKLQGLDELIIIKSWHKEHYWPYDSGSPDDYCVWDKRITELLDEFDQGEVISKRPGPIKENPKALWDMLDPEGYPTVMLGKKRVVIQTRAKNSQGRSVITDYHQIKQLCDLVKAAGHEAIVITFDGEMEDETFADLEEERFCVYRHFNLADQSKLYKDHCLGVIAPNGSGCNLPALWGCPILSFAANYHFPMDFYCFGRMMYYDENEPVFQGAIKKADNIMEVKTDPYVDVEKHRSVIENWLKTL